MLSGKTFCFSSYKQKSFAEKVSREDITEGARELGLELNEHIQFVVDALAEDAQRLGLPVGDA